MRIIIAGAGSGKTTSMASIIAESAKNRLPGKYYFCIAFTNNAVEHISSKLRELYHGEIPKYIKVMTIHSFLYQEVIKPYYYLLYGISYEKVSLKPLGNNAKYHAKEVSDLEKKGALHVSAITQRAMWVLKGKSTDKKAHKDKRKQIIDVFSNYCDHIFVDEAQDIDDSTKQILEALDDKGIDITAVGDPKQDLHGFGNLRLLSGNKDTKVEYINRCYRCPMKHLKISNTIVDDNEIQNSDIDGGLIKIRFETDISDIGAYIKAEEFDLAYIVKRNSRFDTHVNKQEGLFDGLYHLMLELIPRYFEGSELVLRRYSYCAANCFIADTENGKDLSRIVKKIFKGNIEKKEYAQIGSLINNVQSNNANVLVSSIESIKGQEGDNCLFILSKDLASYLFLDKKDDNKMKAALYVALTRSRKDLTILLTTEAEEKYPKKFVKEYFSQMFEE